MKDLMGLKSSFSHVAECYRGGACTGIRVLQVLLRLRDAACCCTVPGKHLQRDAGRRLQAVTLDGLRITGRRDLKAAIGGRW